MANLIDTIINGVARVTGTLFADKIQTNKVSALTSASGTAYGLGSSGQVLKSNGTNGGVYWGDDASSGGTVTSITIKATSPIAIDSATAITTSGTRTLSHANSGVTAGTYKSVTVNATGHVTSGSNPTTLSGYGITDAKIASGVITLGSNTITPLTSSSSLNAANLTGTVPASCYTNTTYTNFVKSGTGAAAGLVPAPSTTAGTTKYLREDGTWTAPPNTDTKVTAVGNHYSPSADSSAALSASATGATAAWSIDVVKGITISRDAKGHVTGVSVTSGKIPANPNTDTKVKSAASTANTDEPILLNNGTSATTNTVLFKSGATINPSTGNLKITQINGVDVGTSPKFTDTVYTHPTTAGNKHIPSGGASGQFLKYSASGTATWAALPSASTSAAGIIQIGTGASNAAAGNHNHDSAYVNVSGDTMTGTLKFSSINFPLDIGAYHIIQYSPGSFIQFGINEIRFKFGGSAQRPQYYSGFDSQNHDIALLEDTTKVTQTSSSSTDMLPVLLSYSASPSSGTANISYFSDSFKVAPAPANFIFGSSGCSITNGGNNSAISSNDSSINGQYNVSLGSTGITLGDSSASANQCSSISSYGSYYPNVKGSNVSIIASTPTGGVINSYQSAVLGFNGTANMYAYQSLIAASSSNINIGEDGNTSSYCSILSAQNGINIKGYSCSIIASSHSDAYGSYSGNLYSSDSYTNGTSVANISSSYSNVGSTNTSSYQSVNVATQSSYIYGTASSNLASTYCTVGEDGNGGYCAANIASYESNVKGSQNANIASSSCNIYGSYIATAGAAGITIPGGVEMFVGGCAGSNVQGSCSGILGGAGHTLAGNNIVILGGTGINATKDNTAYAQNLEVIEAVKAIQGFSGVTDHAAKRIVVSEWLDVSSTSSTFSIPIPAGYMGIISDSPDTAGNEGCIKIVKINKSYGGISWSTAPKISVSYSICSSGHSSTFSTDTKDIQLDTARLQVEQISSIKTTSTTSGDSYINGGSNIVFRVSRAVVSPGTAQSNRVLIYFNLFLIPIN